MLSQEVKQGMPEKKPNTNVRFLKDLGLSYMDSFRAQRIAEHQDLIPLVVVAKAIERNISLDFTLEYTRMQT